ncbi:MAG: hypothetical protein AAGD96_34700, partial [Chloroflexota bacterium]
FESENGMPLIKISADILSYLNNHGAEFFSISIDWHVQQAMSENVTVFVHGVGENGELISQKDGDPIVGTSPLSGFNSGDHLREVRYIPADQRIVEFHIGLYDRTTGSRLPYVDSTGGTADKLVLTIESLDDQGN